MKTGRVHHLARREGHRLIAADPEIDPPFPHLATGDRGIEGNHRPGLLRIPLVGQH